MEISVLPAGAGIICRIAELEGGRNVTRQFEVRLDQRHHGSPNYVRTGHHIEQSLGDCKIGKVTHIFFPKYRPRVRSIVNRRHDEYKCGWRRM